MMVDKRRIDAPVRRAVFLVMPEYKDQHVFIRQPFGNLLIALRLYIRDLLIEDFPFLFICRPYRQIQAVYFCFSLVDDLSDFIPLPLFPSGSPTPIISLNRMNWNLISPFLTPPLEKKTFF